MARYRWVIPDAFLPETSSGMAESHESLCVLNESPTDASLELEAFFEHSEPSRSAPVTIPGRRCLHLRMSDPDRVGGLRIPRGVPYGLIVRSDTPLYVQFSRLDTTQAAYTLMSVLPAPETVEDSPDDRSGA